MVLLTPEQCADLRQTWPPALPPKWDASFAKSAKTWLGKLQGLLVQEGRDVSGLKHCEHLLEHQLPEYCPSGMPLRSKLAQLRLLGSKQPAVADAALSQAIADAARAAFPAGDGLSQSGPLIYLSTQRPGQLGLCQEPLADDMLVVYRWGETDTLPFRVGRILRIVHEAAQPHLNYAVVESWWPLQDPDKYEGRLCAFGTWVPGATPPVKRVGNKRQRQSGSPAQGKVIVRLSEILACPMQLEPGNEDFPAGGRVAFRVLHSIRILYILHDIDVSHARFSFSRRGARLWREVVPEASANLREQQLSERPAAEPIDGDASD